MNRQERRKAQSSTRRAKVDPKVAYHEAGHAVARLLTATAMGHSPAEAVHSIQVAPGNSGLSGDGRTLLVSQAVCTGPMVSRELEDAVKQIIHVHDGMSPAALWDAFAVAGTPADRETSMSSRMLVDVMGAAAESRHLGVWNPQPLFLGYACEDDRADFRRNCMVLGVSPALIGAVRDVFLERARELAARPAVWSAISAIAVRLRSTMSGKEVAALAWPHLEADTYAAELATSPWSFQTSTEAGS